MIRVMRRHDLTNQKENYSDNDKDKDKQIEHGRDMTWRVNLREIVYISDSWEPEIMTIIIVTQQLRVTLDSIRNFCDVYF